MGGGYTYSRIFYSRGEACAPNPREYWAPTVPASRTQSMLISAVIIFSSVSNYFVTKLLSIIITESYWAKNREIVDS